EHLESRLAPASPATLTINNTLGTLVYAGSEVNNNFRLTGTATAYTFNETAEAITLLGDTAGWSGDGTHTVTRPTPAYPSIAVNLGDGNNTATIGSSSIAANLDWLQAASLSVDLGTTGTTSSLTVFDLGAASGNGNVVVGAGTIAGLAGPGDGAV